MLDLNAAFLSQGYGTHFKEKALKTLPVGSVYSEPGGVNHFLRSAEEPVVVDISGFGTTDTRYFNPADDPENGPISRELLHSNDLVERGPYSQTLQTRSVNTSPSIGTYTRNQA